MHDKTYDDRHDPTYKTASIPSIRLDRDVIPLSLFRARVAEFVQQVMATGRPLLITLRGRGSVVLLDVREFEVMRERLGQNESLTQEPP
jgi:prevent-host-death family protein